MFLAVFAVAGFTAPAGTSYAQPSSSTKPRSGLHDRAFGTADWGIAPQPSTEQPLSETVNKQSLGPSGSGSVHFGPLSGAERKAEQMLQQQQKQQPVLKFIKARSFAGAKAGYVFRMGPKGLGYYLEAGQVIAKGKHDKAKQSRPDDSLKTASDKEQLGQSPSTGGVDHSEDMQPVKGEGSTLLS